MNIKETINVIFMTDSTVTMATYPQTIINTITESILLIDYSRQKEIEITGH